MPSALPDLQAAFAAYLGGEGEGDLAATVQGDTIPAAARLRVHLNHVRHSLAGALAATFPTVEALVGPDFFRQMARAYVAGTLPDGPILSAYGGAFPAFVAGWSPARGLPYLADAARLDWALNEAWHAPAGERLTAAALATLPAASLPSLQLVLSAGTVVLASAYPLDLIRAACRPGAGDEPVRLEEGVCLLVLRQDDDAALLRLGPGEAAFLEAVARGGSLESAAGAGLARDRDFDLSSAFARFLALGCFAAMQQ